MRIENATLDDDAEYQCQVGPKGSQKPIRANALLNVLSKSLPASRRNTWLLISRSTREPFPPPLPWSIHSFYGFSGPSTHRHPVFRLMFLVLITSLPTLVGSCRYLLGCAQFTSLQTLTDIKLSS